MAPPYLFWANRLDPYIIASSVVAHSGRVAMVRTTVTGYEGKPMRINYRMASKSDITTWLALVDSDPFAASAFGDNLSGVSYQVIFNPKNPITIENEIIRDYDIGQTIFDAPTEETPNAAYKSGFDYFRGQMNLIIVS